MIEPITNYQSGKELRQAAIDWALEQQDTNEDLYLTMTEYFSMPCELDEADNFEDYLQMMRDDTRYADMMEVHILSFMLG